MTHLLGHPTSPLGPPIYPLSLPSNPLRPHQSRANVRVHGCPVRGALQAWQQHGAAAAAAAHDDAAVCAGIAAAHAPGEVQHGACDPAVLVSATGAGRHGDRGARGRCACLDAQRHASPGRQLPPAPSGRRWAPRAHMCMFGACLVHVWCMFGALPQAIGCVLGYVFVRVRACVQRTQCCIVHNTVVCTRMLCSLSFICVHTGTHTHTGAPACLHALCAPQCRWHACLHALCAPQCRWHACLHALCAPQCRLHACCA